MSSIKKIALFSFADINNYGDLFFTHIFKHELESRTKDLLIDFYTPTNALIEGIYYKSYSRENIEGKYDALILAGGEVIHQFDDRTWKPIYLKYNQTYNSSNPSDIVWDWIGCKSNFKAWISVGVRSIENISTAKIDSLFRNLDIISVRGILSKKLLEGNVFERYNKKIEITPDLGWLIPNFIKYFDYYGKGYNINYHKGFKYLIFQTNNINNDEAQIITDQLMEFERKNKIKVLLLPIIRPWDDIKYLKMIWEKSGKRFIFINEYLPIFQIADIIMHSEMVVCSSLHCAITALSSSIPAAIINKWSGTKLQDFFGLQFRTEFLSNDFNDINYILSNLVDEKKNIEHLTIYSDFIKLRLFQLFDRLVNILV